MIKHYMGRWEGDTDMIGTMSHGSIVKNLKADLMCNKADMNIL